MAFKMKGFSGFKDSPMKQDEKKVKTKFKLKVGTRVDGTKEYFKVDEKGTSIKISESEYNSMKGN